MNIIGTSNFLPFPINRGKETIYQWNVNDYVVYLTKRQGALEYKTIDKDKKEIYAGHIEIPESESIEEMISHLKTCKVMVKENGLSHFLQNFHTWKNANRNSLLGSEEKVPLENEFIHSLSDYRKWKYDSNARVSLVLVMEGLVWNVFQRATKNALSITFKKPPFLL
ncbi:hypothetical protein [Candidatus Rhabdochlamydia porcellionis]|jgi:hypothetical protein|uniref:Uncharacterized protein n=1 Tax=Candidatus Rhabdochlamydia porcellionis TaxID=225148 RepID=A0ABX8YY56_9BACT|nr:hypothetical protein [Candidatus Rhabdochlamydia porcellionis]QZA58221.1 hypothetical protein RHAB15C_0000091 [Candidatus Rhabdochlamydia porcellionis]